MGKTVIVDDVDARILYHGDWTTMAAVGTMETRGKNSNEYNSTVHKSTTSGDSFTFTFEGISLALWGTLDRPSLVGSPRVSFSIDGGTPEAFNQSGLITSDLSTDAMPHMVLYQTPILSKGSHTLNVSIPTAAPAPFYFDFFTIDTGEDSTAGDVIVDDIEFQYSGDWFESGASYEYLHTTHGMWEGRTGSATYFFFGESVTVYGTMGIVPSHVTFTLDGVQMESAPTPQRSTWGAHSIVFYAKDLLEGQQHTLVVSSGPSENAWYLDYLVYHTKNSTSLSVAGQPPVSRGISPSKIGAIIGGVLGGIILLSLVFFGIRRFKQRNQGTSKPRRKTSAPYNSGGDTRSIRSVQSMGGSVDGIPLALAGNPSGILKHSGSSFAAGKRPKIRISEAPSASRLSLRSGTGVSTQQASVTSPAVSSPNIQYGGGFQLSSTGGTETPEAPPMLIRGL